MSKEILNKRRCGQYSPMQCKQRNAGTPTQMYTYPPLFSPSFPPSPHIFFMKKPPLKYEIMEFF